MSDVTERFSGRVREYATYRREYPATRILEFLSAKCGLTATWHVADIAAGTGMLTKVFLGNVDRVTAIEPNAEMREVCMQLRAEWPSLRVMDGTAEITGLETGSVEMVTAGRAFHWFEPELAGAEFRRVLTPGGWVVLISSGRKRDTTERGQDFERLLLEHGTDTEYGMRRRLREAGWGTFLRGLGRPESYGRTVFEEGREIGFEEFRGMVQSVSCAPLPGDSRYPAMQQALRAFFLRWSEGGAMWWVEECAVEVGQVV